MALNLNYAANTYLAVTLPASSSYLQAPASLGLLHPAVAHVGQRPEWEVSEAKRAEILAAFKAVGRVDIQEPKQRAKRGGDEL
ncbi:hypothetical protein DFH08DRAFT_949170 [Mycena albidolilacea]|uniref:Uncharacterized protein n=1 Tax=Mycena albidolilacea TaxID=1033008 RepID=A0AAD7F5P7_9AGAR|nr:hypothetical protein DFH08DRAFT_949170 [Mycena albidolilacea]